MKKMLLATALALLITGCAQQTFTVRPQTGSSSTRAHHPSFQLFWNWAEETVDAAKILAGGAENVGKTETANIRKWIARFYYFRHLCSAGSACVLLTIIA